MSLTSVFYVSIYSLCCLASLTLAIAEGAPFPAALTIPVAFVAMYFTERRKVIRLSPMVANIGGLAALGMAMLEFWGGGEGRLLSGAHLLVYLTWITLFQEKETRQCWWLCALAVLQIAVSSVLTDAAAFGVLLALFVVLGTWTLSVFSLNEARVQFTGNEQYAVAVEGRDGPAPVVERGAFDDSSMARGSVQHDPHERWINSRFVVGVLLTSLMMMAIGMVFFVFIPKVRLGRGYPEFGEQRGGLGSRPLTGFTEQVQLGDIGEILESTEPVLEMWVVDLEKERAGEEGRMSVAEYARMVGLDEPLLRGSVLGRYNNGQWSASSESRYAYRGLLRKPSGRGYRQTIELQSIGTQFLFAMPPAIGGEKREADRKPILRNRFNEALLRNSESHGQRPLRYDIYSPTPVDQLLNIDVQQGGARHGRSFEQYRRSMLRLPDGKLDRLAAMAREKGLSEDESANPAIEVAPRIEAYLSDSSEFSYSLSAAIQDPSIDPVEDFLFNRKEGHCEYYASAMALMLRAVDIPSRLVSGFKGGDENRLTGTFVVEQRHAHAWVEARIDGEWMVFDPTPAARSESVQSMSSPIQSWNEVTQVFREFWREHVVAMNIERQERTLYAPLAASLRDWSKSTGGVRGQFKSFVRRLTALLRSPEKWFSWEGGVVSFVLLCLLSGCVWLGRRLFRLWAGVRERRELWRLRATTPVAFYERFRTLVAEHGLVREAAQTQREFALTVQGRLKPLLWESKLADFPLEISRLFYDVRFGAAQLPAVEMARLNERLKAFAECLRESNGARNEKP
ncbi:MAG: hypothetical protein CMJ48_01615 [Planctomycetaceae bacterium]|nr:hypothetical protein [Planctomycetaceae bacterium]